MFPLVPLFALLCSLVLMTPAHDAIARNIPDPAAETPSSASADDAPLPENNIAPAEPQSASDRRSPLPDADEQTAAISGDDQPAVPATPPGLPGEASATDMPPRIVIRGLAPASLASTGLLAYLDPWLTQETGLTMDWTAVNDSQALALARACGGDVLLANTSDAEAAGPARLVRDDYAIGWQNAMSDTCVVAGPAADPADIRGRNTLEALRAIADSGAPFVSRGDASGLHRREQTLWTLAGRTVREGRNGYGETGQGMTATLDAAAAAQAYVVADEPTFAAWSAARASADPDAAPLVVFVRDEPVLIREWSLFTLNPALCPPVSPAVAPRPETPQPEQASPAIVTPGQPGAASETTPADHGGDASPQTSAAVRAAAVQTLMEWWISPSTQKRIAAYTRGDKTVFTPALPPKETPPEFLPPVEEDLSATP